MIAEPATEPELVTEWMLPGGTLPFAGLRPFVAPFSPVGTLSPAVTMRDGGGWISFLPLVL